MTSFDVLNPKGIVLQVHYVAKWKGITFMTSRQGLGVGGGTVGITSIRYCVLEYMRIL